jgi:hypothetical protein
MLPTVIAGVALPTLVVATVLIATPVAFAEQPELFPEGTFNVDPYLAGEKTDPDDAEEKARLSATYCDRFGPDYVLVEGTTTCIRVGGHVQMDVYIRGRQ